MAQKPRSAATDPSGATGALLLPKVLLLLLLFKYVTPPSACAAWPRLLCGYTHHVYTNMAILTMATLL